MCKEMQTIINIHMRLLPAFECWIVNRQFQATKDKNLSTGSWPYYLISSIAYNSVVVVLWNLFSFSHTMLNVCSLPSEWYFTQDWITIFVSGLEFMRRDFDHETKNVNHCGKQNKKPFITKHIMSNMEFHFIFTETSQRKWLMKKWQKYQFMLFCVCVSFFILKKIS